MSPLKACTNDKWYSNRGCCAIMETSLLMDSARQSPTSENQTSKLVLTIMLSAEVLQDHSYLPCHDPAWKQSQRSTTWTAAPWESNRSDMSTALQPLHEEVPLLARSLGKKDCSITALLITVFTLNYCSPIHFSNNCNLKSALFLFLKMVTMGPNHHLCLIQPFQISLT